MAELFHVNITLPNKVAYEGEVSSLIVPARLGYLGVLAHHAPIIASLKPGTITLRGSSGKTTELASTGNGFLEVSDSKATLILDSLKP